MPNAIQEMAKSAGEAGLTVNGTVKEMLKLQETGGLISSKVLPVFAKNMSLVARNNGGLEKAMLSNRVAMNRFMFSVQETADTIFKSGFGEGLTEFFNTAAESMRDLEPLWKALGKIFGSVFKGLSALIRLVTPTLTALGSILDNITELLGDFSAGVLLLTPALTLLVSSKIRTGVLALGAAFRKTLLPITLMVTAIKELSFWTQELINLANKGDLIGVLYDPRTDKNHRLYDESFAKSPEGLKSRLALDERIASANKNQSGGFSFNSLLATPFSIMSEVKKISGRAAGSVTDMVGLSEQGKVVKVELNVDGEALGSAVSNTMALQDAITDRVINYN